MERGGGHALPTGLSGGAPSGAGGGGPETGLDIYCRGRTGLLADDGARWAVLILPGGGYERIAPAEGEPVALAFLAAGTRTVGTGRRCAS